MNIKQIAIDLDLERIMLFGNVLQRETVLNSFAKAILDIDFPLIGKLLDENAKLELENKTLREALESAYKLASMVEDYNIMSLCNKALATTKDK